jgi:VanZ family protein
VREATIKPYKGHPVPDWLADLIGAALLAALVILLLRELIMRLT